jgi:hypothetical protein
MNLQVFTLPGVGRVMADLTRDDLPPVIQFEDGTHCFGLPRTTDEVSPMGYGSIAEGNFIHEALHMFVSHRCGLTDRSVLYRAGTGADFTQEDILREASEEERIVLGVQVAVNDTEGDGLTTNKVEGFTMHLTAAAREFARLKLAEYGCDLDQVVAEFKSHLHSSGCELPKAAIREDFAGEFGDMFHPDFGYAN